MNQRLKFELAFLLGTSALVTAGLRPRQSKTARLTSQLLTGAAIATVLWPSQRWSLKNRSAVITGGSRGLGLALARQILGEGGRVTLLARDTDELNEARLFLEAEAFVPRGCVFTVACDVTSRDQVEKALAEARARFGGIDLVINNAGAIAVGPIDSFGPEDFEAQMNVHFRGPLNVIMAARPYLHMQGGGHIVNISSIGGRIAIPHMAPYCASKFALGGLSESLRGELKAEGIVVTTVYPGLMRTGSPIQAVFKGDHAREFAWFAAGDSLPILSISAERAAKRILDGCRQGRAEVMVSVPARGVSLFHALFPELFAWLEDLSARLLPKGTSRVGWTGAKSLVVLERLSRSFASRFMGRKLGRFVSETSHRNAARWNEQPKFNAEFNLGLAQQH